MATQTLRVMKGISLPVPVWVRKIKPWVVVALVLSLFLAGYYAILGWRYYTTSNTVEALSIEADVLARAIEATGAPGAMAEPPEDPHAALARVKRQFVLEKSDDALSLVSSLASEEGVTIISANIGDPQARVVDKERYAIQPVSLTVQGKTDALFAYIERLVEVRESAGVPSFRLSNLDGVPVALVQVEIYYNPAPAPERTAVAGAKR